LHNETAAELKSGAVTGLCFGVFVTCLIFLLTWKYWVLLSSSVAPEFQGMVNASDVLRGTFSFIFLASLLDALPGMIVGLFYVKIVNRLPIRSVYFKSVLFGVCMWLVPFVITYLVFPLYQYPFNAYVSTVTVFFLLLLIFYLVDSLLFAYLFNRWSKPSAVRTAGTPLPFLLTLRRMRMLGSVVIVGVMCMMVWRFIQLIPSLETDLSSQLIFLVSIGLLLFFSYALVQIIRFK